MNGKLIESLVQAKIEQKCDIQTDPNFDHVYKLDFLVNRFKSIDKIIPIGVQVTTKPKDAVKMKAFLAERRKKRLVDKSVYLEIGADVDLSAWGSELVYNSLVAFAFQKETGYGEIVGIRINSDVSYKIFDIEECINSIEESAPEAGSALTGSIFRYFPEKNSGNIKCEQGTWFFHTNEIKDSRLTNSFIPHIKIDDSCNVLRPIYVDFENGGYQRDDAKFPYAINIRLAKKD